MYNKLFDSVIQSMKKIDCGNLNQSFSDINYNSISLKKLILESNQIRPYAVNNIIIKLNKNHYIDSLFSDFKLHKNRIDEQIKNINILHDSKIQPAWLIVSVYYACYFMATEISRLSGNFIVNIKTSEYNSLISGTPIKKNTDSSIYTTLHVKFYDVNDNQVELVVSKTAAKPHSLAWDNFPNIENNTKNLINSEKEVKIKKIVELFNNIRKSQCKWNSPSKIRNEWNYTDASLFSEKGVLIAKEFNYLLMNYKECIIWASKTKSPTSNQILISSLAFIYQILLKTYGKLCERINFLN